MSDEKTIVILPSNGREPLQIATRLRDLRFAEATKAHAIKRGIHLESALEHASTKVTAARHYIDELLKITPDDGSDPAIGDLAVMREHLA